MNILPKLIDGGKDLREAQGCHVMAKNEVSHDCAIPGSPDQLGIAPDQRGDLPTQKGRGMGQGESGIVLSLAWLGPGKVLLFRTVVILPK